MILSKDIDVQRILQSDSTRGTTGHTQPQVVVSDPIRWLSPCKKVRNQLTLSRDIDDQRNLQFARTRERTGHNQSKTVVSEATFTWWLTLC